MLGDTSNTEESGEAVDALAREMDRLKVTNPSSRSSDSWMGSPILSSAESYNLTVEEYTISENNELGDDIFADDVEQHEVVDDVFADDVGRHEVVDDMLVDDIRHNNEWLPVRSITGRYINGDDSVYVYSPAFSRGILIVATRPYSLEDEPLLTVSNNSFGISSANSHVDRKFTYCTKGEFLHGKQQIKLCLVEDLPIKGALKQHEIYIKQQGSQLLYAILLDKKRVIGILDDISISTEINDASLDLYKLDILSSLYKKGHIKNMYLTNIELLLNELKQYLEDQPNAIDINNIIVNSKRREEIFFPIILRDSSNDELGFYVYPWIFDNIKDFKFSGFTRFVTAGCMFGTSIKAVDHRDWHCNFIKHNLPFGPDQEICGINIEGLINCYEQTLFKEFDKLLLVVDKLSENSSNKQIYYHLPFYDYMLFGIELFNKNRIKLSALNKFFEAIMNKKEEHVDNINDTCKAHGINCVIGSPFENLFEYSVLELIKKNKKNSKDFSLARAILSCLGMCKESLSQQGEWEYPRYTDEQLISIILDKLNNNNFNLDHQEVWRDFVEATRQDPQQNKVQNIDDLFKLANAIMVAIACKGQQDYKVCALHTLSEKPISVNYGVLRNLLKKAQEKEDKQTYKYKTYAASFNMTVMDPALGYSPSSNGVLFYFPNTYQNEFSDLINNRDILSHMHRNIASITKGRDCTPLEVVLPYLNPLI